MQYEQKELKEFPDARNYLTQPFFWYTTHRKQNHEDENPETDNDPHEDAVLIEDKDKLFINEELLLNLINRISSIEIDKGEDQDEYLIYTRDHESS